MKIPSRCVIQEPSELCLSSLQRPNEQIASVSFVLLSKELCGAMNELSSTDRSILVCIKSNERLLGQVFVHSQDMEESREFLEGDVAVAVCVDGLEVAVEDVEAGRQNVFLAVAFQQLYPFLG